MSSDCRNARPGAIGAPLGATFSSGGSTEVATVSPCCATAGDAIDAASRIASSAALAGECGNRTHPARLSRVTPVLKTGEATRPHPPPRLLQHDRKFGSLRNGTYLDCAGDLRKIGGRAVGPHGYE